MKQLLVSLRLLDQGERTRLVMLTMARVFLNLLDVGGIVLIGFLGAFLASGFREGESVSFLGIEVGFDSPRFAVLLVSGVAALFILKSLLSGVVLYMTTRQLARIEARKASEVARAVFSRNIEEFQELSRGEIDYSVTASTQIAFGGLLYTGITLVSEVSLFLFITVLLLYVDVLTTIIAALFFLLLLLGFQLLINRPMERIGRDIQSTTITLGNFVVDLVSVFREVSVSGKKNSFLESFATTRNLQADNAGLQRFLTASPRFFVEAALMMSVGLLVGFQFARGNLSEGLVVTAVFLVGGSRLMGALLPLQGAIATARMLRPQADRAHQILLRARTSMASEAGKVVDSKSQLDRDPGPLGVTISNVSYRYPGSRKYSLRDLSLHINPGEFAAIIGPSGAGKSTLVDLMLGLLPPTTGSVSIRGASEFSSNGEFHSLARVAYVPQRPGLVSGSILQNVALKPGSEDCDRSLAWEVLEITGLGNVVREIPGGIDASLGQQMDSLSGGQIQRLGIARALYHRPRLLILDESTSNLDPESEHEFLKNLMEMKKDFTLLVVAHKPSIVGLADVVHVLREGKIEQSGKWEMLRATNLYAKRFKA